ncbi:MAG: cyclic nucleotide-binding domain-containing protein [Bacteroidota bacterium]
MFKDNQDIIETLSQANLFSGLSSDALKLVAQKAKVRQYFPHDVIVWQGQPSTTLFFIMNGIVAVKNMVKGKENILAYLMRGNTFGEVGILENQPRSASVMAISDVDVLVIQRDDFLNIMHKHSTVAIELAKILGRYLVQSSRRIANDQADFQLILLFNAQDQTGSTTLGTLLAQEMYETRKTSTAYLEYPNPWRVLKGEQLPKGKTVYNHPNGYDILFPQQDDYLPFATQTTILLDKIKHQYTNIVINIHGGMDDAIYMMLEDATQVLVLSQANELGIKDAKVVHKQLKAFIRPNQTRVFSIFSQRRPDDLLDEVEPLADYMIPYIEQFPTFHLKEPIINVPEEMMQIVSTCLDRLERSNSIGMFIPTTVDGDQVVNTENYMEEALNFMAELFGGATCKVGNGVWNSESLGLIGEMVYIIHSYITQNDLDRHLDEVLDYLRRIKYELKQEAMALEINNKLTLI